MSAVAASYRETAKRLLEEARVLAAMADSKRKQADTYFAMSHARHRLDSPPAISPREDAS